MAADRGPGHWARRGAPGQGQPRGFRTKSVAKGATTCRRPAPTCVGCGPRGCVPPSSAPPTSRVGTACTRRGTWTTARADRVEGPPAPAAAAGPETRAANGLPARRGPDSLARRHPLRRRGRDRPGRAQDVRPREIPLSDHARIRSGAAEFHCGQETGAVLAAEGPTRAEWSGGCERPLVWHPTDAQHEAAERIADQAIHAPGRLDPVLDLPRPEAARWPAATALPRAGDRAPDVIGGGQRSAHANGAAPIRRLPLARPQRRLGPPPPGRRPGAAAVGRAEALGRPSARPHQPGSPSRRRPLAAAPAEPLPIRARPHPDAAPSSRAPDARADLLSDGRPLIVAAASAWGVPNLGRFVRELAALTGEAPKRRSAAGRAEGPGLPAPAPYGKC